ncbi:MULTISPECIES: tyrosine--tRNA ligase [Thermoanaerobacter]|uniref:Tyrosine--tRNA ligase n=2 Tax=Thermoanaerobacter TaxID=1754 RepID=B0KB10_THEP3|nr:MULTISPECIES: tyrosine--tRNA ligase [Thermoanaerobacter]ABY93781.1 tyrosyl-tRNA synthetase [Thermoanaerobacter pseudethanolicus ATCC 33223]ADV78747.1 tyrosyl-tRNA synthetase [Thermoanaerobacter brockii subsp. finnii Ako-1]HBW60746.1 tyrosine--tRNA ligase [Thermoanaerobacter sp.]
MSALDVLQERGYIQQMTHEEEIRELLEKEKITFYIGFDPTADSLHVGHFLQIMVMSHMQKAGHRPIVLIGGGTAMVGDPSGRTDMRKMLTKEEINRNAEAFKKQMQRLIDFSDGKAIMANNADWLLNLNYIEFLRDIGVHFSVNRMLTAECFKSRLERGLSFLEFNYMLMQAYDFLELNKRYNCVMQMGGDDQWSNIIAGIELIRKKEGKQAYGMTFTLLTTSEGKKMGKTQKGAVWLDPNKTSPYEFYQYWRNIADADVEKALALLTFLPMDEVRRLGALKDKEINEAKKILAYEVTKLIHGEEEAIKAQKAAEALFESGGDLDNVPSVTVSSDVLGKKILDVLFEAKIIPSKSEGRRLVQQGGLYINNEKVESIDEYIKDDMIKDNSILIRKGKKEYHRLVIKE